MDSNQPFAILSQEEVFDELLKYSEKCEAEICIVTAYCKISTLKLLNEHIKKEVKKSLLVRFLPSDLAQGATDKEIYEFCKLNNWVLYFDPRIHAKTFLFDDNKCIIGSSNLTNNGMFINQKGNRELNILFKVEFEDYQKILSLFDSSTIMTDELYKQLTYFKKDEDVFQCIDNFYWQNEKINCIMPEDFCFENLSLIEFRKTKPYIFIRQYLNSKQRHEASFGELAELLHSVFVKEPKMFRKDVKDYLSTFLSFVLTYQDDIIKIGKYNYSQKIYL